MKQNRAAFACLVALALAAVPVSGTAQWRNPGRWAAPVIDLSDEQTAKIEEIRLAFQEKLLPLRTQWQKAGLRLDSLAARGAGQKDLDAAWEEMEKAEAELEKAYQAHRNEIRGLLSEDQKALFDRAGGLGLGLGWDTGMTPRWGMRMGGGRGYGVAWGAGPGWGLGFGRGRGGMGRGYYCPWLYWR